MRESFFHDWLFWLDHYRKGGGFILFIREGTTTFTINYEIIEIECYLVNTYLKRRRG